MIYSQEEDAIKFHLPVAPEVLKNELLELHGEKWVLTHFFKYIHFINLIYLKTRGEELGQGKFFSFYNGNKLRWRKNTLRFVYGEKFFPHLRRDLVDLGY